MKLIIKFPNYKKDDLYDDGLYREKKLQEIGTYLIRYSGVLKNTITMTNDVNKPKDVHIFLTHETDNVLLGES